VRKILFTTKGEYMSRTKPKYLGEINEKDLLRFLYERINPNTGKYQNIINGDKFTLVTTECGKMRFAISLPNPEVEEKYDKEILSKPYKICRIDTMQGVYYGSDIVQRISVAPLGEFSNDDMEDKIKKALSSYWHGRV